MCLAKTHQVKNCTNQELFFNLLTFPENIEQKFFLANSWINWGAFHNGEEGLKRISFLGFTTFMCYVGYLWLNLSFNWGKTPPPETTTTEGTTDPLKKALHSECQGLSNESYHKILIKRIGEARLLMIFGQNVQSLGYGKYSMQIGSRQQIDGRQCFWCFNLCTSIIGRPQRDINDRLSEFSQKELNIDTKCHQTLASLAFFDPPWLKGTDIKLK